MNRGVIESLFEFSNSGRGSYLVHSDKTHVDEVIDKILIEISPNRLGLLLTEILISQHLITFN